MKKKMTLIALMCTCKIVLASEGGLEAFALLLNFGLLILYACLIGIRFLLKLVKRNKRSVATITLPYLYYLGIILVSVQIVDFDEIPKLLFLMNGFPLFGGLLIIIELWKDLSDKREENKN